MPRLVPLLAFLITLPAFAAQRMPGPERPVSASVVAPAGGGQWFGGVAPAGDGFVVTWANRGSFYASWLTPGRTFPDAHPVKVDVGGLPVVAEVGGASLVAWKDGASLFGGRLTETGAVVDRTHLGMAAREEQLRVFAGNGSIAVLVASDPLADRARMRVLGPSARPVTDWIELGRATSAAGTARVAVAADPGGFVVLNIEDTYGPEGLKQVVHGRRVTSAGVTGEVRIDTSANPVNDIGVAYDGSRFLVALASNWWMTGDRGTRGVFVTPDLAISDIFPVAPQGLFFHTAVGRSGRSLLFFSESAQQGFGSATHVLRFDHATRSASALERVSPADRYASNGRDLLAVSSPWPGIEDQHVLAQWINPTDGQAVSNAFVLSLGTVEQAAPAAALGKQGALLVWQETESPGNLRVIRGTRIAADGTVLDRTPLWISRVGVRSLSPAVAFNGTHFVVVWAEEVKLGQEGRLVARRVSEDGILVDDVPIVVSEQYAETPAVAQSGDTTLITWIGIGERVSTHGFGREVFGARMNPDGFVIDSLPLLVSRDPWDHYAPDVAGGADGFLVSWKTFRWYGYHSPVSTGASTARVSAGGTVHEPIALTPLASYSGAEAPQVAWNGQEYLAAWSVAAQSNAALISTSGAVTRRETLPSLPSIGEAAFFDGSWHIVSGTSGGPFGRVDHFYLSPTLAVERILPELNRELEMIDPAIASDGQRAILAYRRSLSAPPHNGSARVLFRLYDVPVIEPSRRRALRP